jgi:hypothetical protein
MIVFIGCRLNASLDRDVSEAAASDPRQTVIADTRRCAGHDRDNVVTAHFLESLAPQRPGALVCARRSAAIIGCVLTWCGECIRRCASLGARIAELRGC